MLRSAAPHRTHTATRLCASTASAFPCSGSGWRFANHAFHRAKFGWKIPQFGLTLPTVAPRPNLERHSVSSALSCIALPTDGSTRRTFQRRRLLLPKTCQFAAQLLLLALHNQRGAAKCRPTDEAQDDSRNLFNIATRFRTRQPETAQPRYLVRKLPERWPKSRIYLMRNSLSLPKIGTASRLRSLQRMHDLSRTMSPAGPNA